MYDEWKYARLRQQELLLYAEHSRLANLALGRRKSRLNRALARIGGWMVALGEALHRRYAPAKPAVVSYESALQSVVRSTMVTWDAGFNDCERRPGEAGVSETSFLKTAHTRRHSPSRKKSSR